MTGRVYSSKLKRFKPKHYRHQFNIFVYCLNTFHSPARMKGFAASFFLRVLDTKLLVWHPGKVNFQHQYRRAFKRSLGPNGDVSRKLEGYDVGGKMELKQFSIWFRIWSICTTM